MLEQSKTTVGFKLLFSHLPSDLYTMDVLIKEKKELPAEAVIQNVQTGSPHTFFDTNVQ